MVGAAVGAAFRLGPRFLNLPMKKFPRFLVSILVLRLGFLLHAQVAGTLDVGFNPILNGTFPPNINATPVQPDGKILIGGAFSSVNGTPRTNIARLNANGSLDTNFSFSYMYTGEAARFVTVQADGKAIMGFLNGFRRFNVDATPDIGQVTDTNGTVHCMVLQPDGKILIGGNFSSIGGQPREGIARINANGTVEDTSTFNIGTGVVHLSTGGGGVHSMALQPDGKILIGGIFTTVNGLSRNYIARLLPDGTVEDTTTFNTGAGPNTYIRAISIQADGKILIGGDFTTVNGLPRKCLARLLSDGTVESTATFDPGTGPNGSSNNGVYGLAVQVDGRILIGGGFTSVNGLPRTRIARLLQDGTVEDVATFNPGTGANDRVYGLALQADGRVLVGGYFTTMNGQPRKGIARLTNDLVSQTLTVPSSTRVRWMRSGAAPEVQEVTFELSTNGGANWSPLGEGARVAGGWESAGLNLPASGSIRARGRANGGYHCASSGLVEQVTAFTNLTPFSQWKFTQLGDANVSDFGDTDFDGLVHLAEYALNLSPTAPSLPPPAERHLYAEGERLRMSFTRDPARNDVTLEVQSADGPAGPWTTIAASTLGGVTIGPGYVGGDDATPGLKTVEVRDTVDISPTAPSRYLRVKVTH